MSEIITVGLDLAKNVFQIQGADGAGRAILRKRLRRAQVLDFFSQLPSCVVAMEACGGAHLWRREIGKLGHKVQLIPPDYVKPFVKRQKNDAADAEAICEAVMRPTMRFVHVKREEAQAAAMVFRVRKLLIRQRTQAINALRGHLTVFGQVVSRGATNASKLVAIVEDRCPMGDHRTALPWKTVRSRPNGAQSAPVRRGGSVDRAGRCPVARIAR